MEWRVIQSPTDADMHAVQGVYLVADKLPIEDANMIAAAPDMLGALKEVSFLHADSRPDVVQEAIDVARGVIAKAEGRS